MIERRDGVVRAIVEDDGRGLIRACRRSNGWGCAYL